MPHENHTPTSRKDIDFNFKNSNLRRACFLEAFLRQPMKATSLADSKVR